MPHSKSIKKVVETLVNIIENDLTDIQILAIAGFLDSFLVLENKDINPNIFEDADKEVKGKKVKFINESDEDEDNDEDDSTPVAKKSKGMKGFSEDTDNDGVEDDDYDTDDIIEDSNEDYDIDTESDDEPKSKAKTKTSKIKFDPDDFDTWTVDNIKQIRKDVAEYDINMKLFKNLDDEEFVEKAIELVEACQQINKKLDSKSDSAIIKLAQKNKIKVGKGKNARDDAQYKLYLLEVKKLK